MKMNRYDLEEENAARIQIIREEVQHLSSSLEGILKKVQSLEKTKIQQDELNEAVSTAITEIADELHLISEDGAES